VQEFEHHLETRLWELRREVEAGTYRWGAYHRFLIRDPKRREIRAPPFRDRVLHHALFTVIDPLFARGYITDTYACIRGRGTHRAVRRYREFVRARGGLGYTLQCDIQRYFASVDHGLLMSLLARRIGDARLLALLNSLIDHGAERPGTGMPIGNLTSQMFANLYLDPFDHFVKETLRVRHYIRYMDDFLLLVDGRHAARAGLAAIEAFLLTRLRLRLNPSRVVLSPLTCARDVLGYIHRVGEPTRIRRTSVRRLWRRIATLDERLGAGRVAWASARASLASWFGLAKHADAFRLSRAIFSARDVRNLGKRLLVHSLQARRRRTAASGVGSGAPQAALRAVDERQARG
jgi:hypothetical protein